MSKFQRGSLFASTIALALMAEANDGATGSAAAGSEATAPEVTKITAAMLNEQAPQAGKVWTETVVRFRKTKDADGNEVAARAPIQLFVPLVTAESVIALVNSKNEDGTPTKVAQWIVDLVADAQLERVKGVTSDMLADGKEVTIQTFPQDEVTPEAIANLPQAERKGRGIAEEVWKSFETSYTDYYLNVAKFEKPKVVTALAFFLKRLQPAKANKGLLEKLRTYLANWYAGVNGSEDDSLTEVYKFLDGKIEEFLAVNPDDALNNI